MIVLKLLETTDFFRGKGPPCEHASFFLRGHLVHNMRTYHGGLYSYKKAVEKLFKIDLFQVLAAQKTWRPETNEAKHLIFLLIVCKAQPR